MPKTTNTNTKTNTSTKNTDQNNKPNILQLCLSTGVGGLELYAVRSAQQLLKNHFSCIAVVRDNTLTSQRMREGGVKTLSLHRRLIFFPAIAAYKLAKIIDRQQVDIIHMHWGKDLNLAVLAKLLATRKVKLVYTRQMVITRPKFDIYHRFLYRHVDLFLTITKQLLDQVRQFLPMPHTAMQLLYYGVAKPIPLEATQRQALRDQFGIPDENTFAIGLIGRIEHNKGQHVLIEAVDQLQRRGFSVHATIIGPVMDQVYFSRLKQDVERLHLGDKITFHGSHNNPIDIMAAFDVVVLATEQETFGLVLIEAMRAGVAVIGTNAGGVPEIIQEGVNGLLFEPNNVKQLGDQLALLANNSDLRQKLAAKGCQFADQKFSLERHYEQLAHHFKSLHSSN